MTPSGAATVTTGSIRTRPSAARPAPPTPLFGSDTGANVAVAAAAELIARSC